MVKKLALLVMAATVLALPRPASGREASEGSKHSESLLRGGSDDDITGRADFKSRNGRSSFRIRLQRGPTNHELEIRVGGVSRGMVMTS